MRILLTNDDGLRAPGIAALHGALTGPGTTGGPLAELVLPIAPLTVQSATSHGVTFHQPLMVSEIELSPRMRGIAVDGRPADCVKLALTTLWPERFGPGARPDLVVSGMNDGANVGINVIYSGTVAAALEAAFLGVPSVAVSLHRGNRPTRFDVAAAHGRRALERILAAGPLEPHTCLSVNIPRLEEGGPLEEELELKVCPMNTHGLNDSYERRVSPAGDVYYWASGHGLDFRFTDAGSDVQLLFRRCITVTPLMYDLTRHDALTAWIQRLER
ncbi:MAG TPA: 5'/3'-nucleotidase SurE [Phycisphaerales bacterium]|nr:5'/3'-nucleotidase SurE [Phycisphaerales bacterium]